MLLLHTVCSVRCSECIPEIFAAVCSWLLDCSPVDPTNGVFAFQHCFVLVQEIVLSTIFNSLQSNVFVFRYTTDSTLLETLERETLKIPLLLIPWVFNV